MGNLEPGLAALDRRPAFLVPTQHRISIKLDADAAKQ
jgi:SPX domain protein involved in polyphosphate accumulation